jgi:hypothetical protein
MKTLATTALFALGLLAAGPALAQDAASVQDTVNDINQAVVKAQVQLATQLGLLPAQETQSPTPLEDQNAPAEGGAVVEEAQPTVDIMAAEQQFWSDYYAQQSDQESQGGEETEGNEQGSNGGQNTQTDSGEGGGGSDQ